MAQKHIFAISSHGSMKLFPFTQSFICTCLLSPGKKCSQYIYRVCKSKAIGLQELFSLLSHVLATYFKTWGITVYFYDNFSISYSKPQRWIDVGMASISVLARIQRQESALTLMKADPKGTKGQYHGLLK